MSLLLAAGGAGGTALTSEQIAVLLAAVGGPISGIIIAWMGARRSKRQVAAENQTATRTVAVTERDAHTREISAIIDGYTAVNKATTEALTRAENASSTCAEKYDALEARFEEAERQRRIERRETIEHWEALERLIPTPPGPPERPAWAS